VTPPSATTPPAATPSASPNDSAGEEQRQVSLRPGDSGKQVRELQTRLTSLGYWLGRPDGDYGHLTQQAVLALQKAAGLNRDGVFGPQTRAALYEAAQPQPRRTVGSGLEVDLDRQLALYVKNGVLTLVLNASTGSGGKYLQQGVEQVAITPTGKFTVFREVDGMDPGPLGPLWRPKYFVGGVAVHGYTNVPAYPASHGCIRVSDPAMDHLWASAALPIGSSVWVY
jgi:peptidoglycan hydrolase-like protein with peptidoglycan-binding domain